MKKSRRNRILIGLFGPTILGSLISSVAFIAYSLIEDVSGIQIGEWIGTLMFLFMFSIPFMGPQSIIYTLLMEFFVSKKTENIYLFVGTSSLLGLMAGISLILIDFKTVILPLVGLVTGLILGYVLFSMRDTNRSASTKGL